MVILEKFDGDKWDVVFCGTITSIPLGLGESLTLFDTVDNSYYSTSPIVNMTMDDFIISLDTKSGSKYKLINMDFTL
jgi:hypothetical protein